MNSNILIFIAIGVILLGGLFFLTRPKQKTQIRQNTQFLKETNISPTSSSIKIFKLVLKGRKIISGPQTLKVNQNDKVTIRIVSDVADELHIHGYDQHLEFEAAEEAELAFIASNSGRFEMELHGTEPHTDIGALEVYPK